MLQGRGAGTGGTGPVWSTLAAPYLGHVVELRKKVGDLIERFRDGLRDFAIQIAKIAIKIAIFDL